MSLRINSQTSTKGTPLLYNKSSVNYNHHIPKKDDKDGIFVHSRELQNLIDPVGVQDKPQKLCVTSIAVKNIQLLNSNIMENMKANEHKETEENPLLLIDPTKDYSANEINKILSELNEVDMNDEMMDPIEWTVRKVIPIPKHYYWEVIDVKSNPNQMVLQNKVSTTIKIWHNIISTFDTLQNYTTNNIAKPVADMTGITGSRFYYVNDWMTNRDLQNSKRYVDSRLREDSERSNTDTDLERSHTDTLATLGTFLNMRVIIVKYPVSSSYSYSYVYICIH